MTPFGRFGGPPPAWWPAGEPWPPRGRAWHAHDRRTRFMRRTWAGWWMIVALFWWVVGSQFWRAGWGPHPDLIGNRGGPPWPLFIFGFFAVAFVVATAVLTRRIAGPIADLVAAADRVSRADYTARVEEHGPASVRSVAKAFNDMATRLESQNALRRQLMADIAHELRTPLTVIQGRLEGLLDGVYARDDDQLEILLTETRVLARLVEDLRTVAHAEGGTLALHHEPVDLDDLLREVAAAARPHAQAAGVEVMVGDADGKVVDVDVMVGDAALTAPITADPIRLREVLSNLVRNGIQHTPSGGRVQLSARRDGDAIRVTVEDTGRGMPADELARIFDRFYKGRESAGTGLGLAIAKGIVEAHGGTINATSQPGVGTRVTFTIPVTPPVPMP